MEIKAVVGKEMIISKEEQFANDIAELIRNFLRFTPEKRNLIKVVLQARYLENDKENIGEIRYTDVMSINSFTPEAEKLKQKLKLRINNVENFMKLIMCQGIWIGLNKKILFGGENKYGLNEQFNKYNGWVNELDNGGLPGEFQDKINNDFNEFNNVNKDDISQNLKSIWENCKKVLKKSINKYKKNDISEIIVFKELLKSLPQQSLRAGFSPDIFSKGIYKSTSYTNYIREESKSIWSDFLIKTENKTVGIIEEWINYNIITTLEFYFMGGLNGLGDSIVLLYPASRIEERFGLVAVIVNKDLELQAFDELCKTITFELGNFIPQILNYLIERYDNILIEKFLETSKDKILSELLEGKITGKEKAKAILNEVHNEKKLISIYKIKEGEKYPYPNDLDEIEGIGENEKNVIKKKWEYRWNWISERYDKYLESIQQVKEKIIFHAFRSAVAAIMSRNMSHNIGSHVLSRLSNCLSNQIEIDKLLKIKEINLRAKLKKITDPSAPGELKNEKDKNVGMILNQIKNENKKKSVEEYLIQHNEYVKYEKYDEEKVNVEFLSIGRFLKYLQNRQEFIATVTGSGKDVPIFQNFKNDILDELFISEKRERHNKSALKNILLENIVRSENVTGEMIKIYFNHWELSEKEHKDKNIAQHLNIALPAGNLGAHAFFSIFENFIRNSVKHSGKEISTDKPLKVKIETPDVIWDEGEKIIKNDFFAGKVFWVEQINKKDHHKKGPYYIIKNREDNESYIFYAEIPFKIDFSREKDSINFNFNKIKDLKEINSIKFNDFNTIIEKGKLHLKLLKEKEDCFSLVILNENDEVMRSYPLQIIKNEKNKEEAYIFITNKFNLKKNEDNLWEITNVEMNKFHETEKWLNKKIKLQEKIKINDYFNLRFDNEFYNPDELIRITLGDNLGNYNKFQGKIKKGLMEDFIDSTGRLLESNKGLKEMWISACWMRGEELNKEKIYKPPILSCVCNITQSDCFNCHLKNEHGSLQYVFFLRKAKEVLFILDNNIKKENVLTNFFEKKCNSYGIDFKSYDEYKKTKSVYKYLVFVFNNIEESNSNMKKNAEENTNNRAIIIDVGAFRELINNSPQGIKAGVLKKWIEKKWKNDTDKDQILIFDDLIGRQSKEDIKELGNKILVIHPSQETKEVTSGKKIYIWKKHFDSPDEFDSMPDAIKNSDFIESITGNNKTSWLIRDYEPKDEYWRLSLLEAAKCKILIIDERIWEEFSNINIKEINTEKLEKENKNIKLYLNKKNIEIWNLLIKNSKNTEIYFINLLGDKYKLEFKKNDYDIITIHQGIIDKIIKNSRITLADLESIFDGSKAKIITHSGRSRPDSKEMLYGEKGNFISFTSLDSALKDSKYHLVNLLYSVKGGEINNE